jgi:hypothetical protein
MAAASQPRLHRWGRGIRLTLPLGSPPAMPEPEELTGQDDE